MKKFTAKITRLKALICAGILALGLTSCFEAGPSVEKTTVRNDVVATRVEYVDGASRGRDYTRDEFRLRKFEYEGHSYLYFTESSGHRGWAGLTHDENCKCRKNVSND